MTEVWVATASWNYEGSSFIAVAKSISGVRKEVAEWRKDQGLDKPLRWTGKGKYRYAVRPKGEFGSPDSYDLEKVRLFD